MYVYTCQVEPSGGSCTEPAWVNAGADPLTMADMYPILAALLVAFVIAALGRKMG